METVAVIVIVVGLIFMAVGLVVFLLPLRSEVEAQGTLSDIEKVLEQVNTLLDKFDKRYRPGLVLMLLGLALVGLGVFLQARETHTASAVATILLTAH